MLPPPWNQRIDWQDRLPRSTMSGWADTGCPDRAGRSDLAGGWQVMLKAQIDLSA
jgi:hypothetical protein